MIVGYVGVTGSLVAAATFSSTVGLGSILVAMLVVGLAGIFGFRDRRNSGWKDLYEQEREKNGNLIEDKELERTARHSIKDELAATKALLLIEEAKPDLSVILEQQRILWTDATTGLTDTLRLMQKTQEQMLGILTKGAKT